MTHSPRAERARDLSVACVVGVGSNVGDRRSIVDEAVERLRAIAVDGSVRVSPWIETAPIGGPTGQSPFLNGAVALESTLSSRDLLAELHRIESSAGRTREVRWGARTLDLDLLLYGQLNVVSDELTLPHPRLAVRRFALEPATAVAPWMRHPRIGWPLATLLAHLGSSAAPSIVVCPESMRERALRIARAVTTENVVVQTREPGRNGVFDVPPRIAFVLAPSSDDGASWRASIRKAEFAGRLGATLWLDGSSPIERAIDEVRAALCASR